MAYGLEVTGPNDSFVIDSTISGATYMPVVKGDGTVSNGSSYSDYTLGDIIYARPSTGSGTIFCDFTNPSSPTAVGDQNFILLRSSATAPSTTQNGSAYGLQVLDEVVTVGGTSTQAVMYDSRQTANGFTIKASKGIGDCPGGVSGYNGTPTESNANKVYTSFGSSTYAMMNGMASLTQGYMKLYLGYNFKAGTTIIYWAGWYQYSGFGETGFGPLANFGTLMVGDLIT
tara:strand:- start:330 stop:1016 length:687 start_codon:yes stop_codon:yes gene_type:complete